MAVKHINESVRERMLAARYGVSLPAIAAVRSRRTWKHV